MIEEKDLYDMGFKKGRHPYSKNERFMLGEVEEENVLGEIKRNPVIYYDMNKGTCKTHRSEFTIIIRKCETKDEIRKFVECVNFLFNLSVDIN